MVDQSIADLVEYGLEKGLISKRERVYSMNMVLDLMKQDGIENVAANRNRNISEILKELLDEAVNKGITEDSVTFRDLFDAKLMNCIMPRPAAVQEKFEALYMEDPQKATDWFYDFSIAANYIRKDRIEKDEKWITPTDFGDLEITINLSKPEKDPKAIAAARNAANTAYPKCQLCMENEGYAGRADHPGRANHRIIDITVNNSDWAFQYSPYVYFNEHCIVLNQKHEPMAINKACFKKLFDFVEQFPHYFLGSNADLPIVGGSILSHDHFQGGHHDFPMAKAPVEKKFVLNKYPEIQAGIVCWPMSVIRLAAQDKEMLIEASTEILDAWRKYTDEEAMILAHTNGEDHNTITPIVRKRDGLYEIDLVLRNNLTTEEHPLGLYHPHTNLHHIKKENIGLIEVLGLAILPSRLKKEMEDLKEAILSKKDLHEIEDLKKHADWVYEFMDRYDEINNDTIDEIIRKEIGAVFLQVLKDAGVYKTDAKSRQAFMRFVNEIGGQEI